MSARGFRVQIVVHAAAKRDVRGALLFVPLFVLAKQSQTNIRLTPICTSTFGGGDGFARRTGTCGDRLAPNLADRSWTTRLHALCGSGNLPVPMASPFRGFYSLHFCKASPKIILFGRSHPFWSPQL